MFWFPFHEIQTLHTPYCDTEHTQILVEYVADKPLKDRKHFLWLGALLQNINQLFLKKAKAKNILLCRGHS